ncbi:serine protease [Streptomyces sp. TRM 70361]|uniref:serine protease n=1 Tax=Streptomyces sp. TRM 70361 TaxID=3116553 RepID=UPI002E7B359B|nr:serine protease [Streptomyces sp. TRM 70361]MEE1942844.1 serine protease [Streptomyces sp. TRM 70361]
MGDGSADTTAGDTAQGVDGTTARRSGGSAGRAGRAAWRARIRSSRTGKVIGSGVLLGGDTVLTCAHVPADRNSAVTVEFPEIAGAEASTATVLDGCWVPAQGRNGDRGDLALLRVHRPPPGGHSAPLRRASLRNARVEICGYAESVRHAQGAALQATVSMNFGERVQLHVQPAHLPRSGFSGGPVLDMNDPPSVLGITVTGYFDSAGVEPLTLAHMIPVETIVRYLPRVRDWGVSGRRGVEPPLASRAGRLRATPEVEYAERLASWLRGEDGSPVYVTEVRPDSGRDHTLQRALALADREISARATTVLSTDPLGTVPPVGSLDLAVDVRGATVGEVVVQVAERMNLKESDPGRALERLRGEHLPLTVALLGVDRAADPEGLVGLCGEFADRGCRQLLVHYGPGPRIDQEELALRHRMGELAGRLGALDERLRELIPAAHRLAGVSPPHRAVTRLHMDLALLRHAHRGGDGPPPRQVHAALEALERRARRAESDAAETRERAERGYERRAVLRGELRTYRQLAVRHGRIEDVDLDREYRTAHRALHTGRFEEQGAAAAVARYVAVVRRALGWPPQDAEPARDTDPAGAAAPAAPVAPAEQAPERAGAEGTGAEGER